MTTHELLTSNFSALNASRSSLFIFNSYFSLLTIHIRFITDHFSHLTNLHSLLQTDSLLLAYFQYHIHANFSLTPHVSLFTTHFYSSFLTVHFLMPTPYSSFFTFHWLLISVLHTPHCPVFTGHLLLHTTYFPLPSSNSSLPCNPGSSRVTYHQSLVIPHFSLLTSHFSLLIYLLSIPNSTLHCSFFTSHSSSLTSNPSLLTSHCFTLLRGRS